MASNETQLEDGLPTMKLYQNGLSTYMGGTGDHERAPRGEIVGWSAAAARRHRQWAWSIDADSLTGHGYALTLTMRLTPENAKDFEKLRKNYVDRIERMGNTRLHWVVEWQARGTPHIHAAVYFERELDAVEITLLVAHWMVVAADYEATRQGQVWEHIRGPLGWLKYLAKHATRGVAHYQRQGHPEGWEKTGRLWGHRGDWPAVEPIVLDGLNNREFWRLRRISRAWAVADARKVGDWSRVSYLRRAGRPGNAQQSRYQGVSDWIPIGDSLRLVAYFESENA